MFPEAGKHEKFLGNDLTVFRQLIGAAADPFEGYRQAVFHFHEVQTEGIRPANVIIPLQQIKYLAGLLRVVANTKPGDGFRTIGCIDVNRDKKLCPHDVHLEYRDTLGRNKKPPG